MNLVRTKCLHSLATIVPALALATGCGGASNSRSYEPSGATSGGSTATTTTVATAPSAASSAAVPIDQAAGATPSAVAPAATTPSASPATPRSWSGGSAGSASTMAAGAQIEQLESRIRAGIARLSTATGGCDDLCRAVHDICGAAREICELVGDGDGSRPSDDHCRRAQAACGDASRQGQQNSARCACAR